MTESLHNYRSAKAGAIYNLKNDILRLLTPFIQRLTDAGKDDAGTKVAIPYSEKIDAFRGALNYVLDITLEPDQPIAKPRLPEKTELEEVEYSDTAYS